ncbi:MAG TPA: CBS domain-containing protein [Thermoanaerobaculia bacterium]
MRSVAELLHAKGNQVWAVAPDQTVLDALRVMAEKEVGALLVTSGEKVLGILSERDYARKIVLKGRSSESTAVADVMSSEVTSVSSRQSIEECMAVMTEKRIRHLPVIDEGKLVGIVSIGDLVKAVIEDQKFTISQLEHYIHT